VVALAVAAGICVALQVGKVPPLMPQLRAEFALGLVAAGWIASAINATTALFGILGGVFADRVGRWRALVAGLGLVAAGSLAGALAEDAGQLLASRFLEGAGFVLVIVAAPSLIALAAAGHDRRFALGLWSAYMPTGAGLMMALAPLFAGSADWRAAWLASGVLLAAFALFSAAVARGPAGALSPPHSAPAFASLRGVLARPGPWLMAGCFTTYALQWFAVVTWLPTFAIEALGFEAAAAALFTALVVFINAFGNVAGGWLLQRGVPRWLLIAGASLALGLSALGIFDPALPAAAKLGLALAFSLLGGTLPASILAGVPAHAASQAELGATNGIIVQGANIGSFSGPPALAALVTLLGGWGDGRWLLLGAGLTGALLALALRRVERRL
jgi:MFS family permease